jgi:hypothetical protein
VNDSHQKKHFQGNTAFLTREFSIEKIYAALLAICGRLANHPNKQDNLI